MANQTINIELKFSKKSLIYLAIIVILAIFAIVNYRYKFIEQGIAYYNRASASLMVIDKETKKPIDSALVAANSISVQTDVSGYVVVSGLEKGNVSFFINKEGYKETLYSADLKRGANDLGQIVLSKKPEKNSTVSGSVTDVFSKAKVENVLINIEKNTGNSSKEGSFSISGLPLKKTKIKITKAGYLDYENDIEITSEPLSLQVNLVPRGKIYFTSDRDGKSAIYQSNLDGSAVEKLINNVKDGVLDDEMSNVASSSFSLSPDYKYIVFLTSDDPKNEGQKKLYFATNKGEDIQKISDDVNPYNIKWVAPKKISYVSYQDGKYYLKVVDLDNLSVTQINENIENQNYWYISSYDVNTNGLLAYTLSASSVENLNKSGVYLINPDGSNRILVTDKQCGNLMFSFDGKSLFCSVYENSQDKNYKIDLETNTISEEKNVFSKYYQTIKLSPDGKKVLYSDTRDGKTDLFLSDIDGKNEIRLTDVGVVGAFSWSSSGRLISYVSSKDGLEVRVLSPDSKEDKSVSTCNSYSVSLMDSN